MMIKINRFFFRFCADVDRIQSIQKIILAILKHSGSGLLTDAINDRIRNVSIDDAVRNEMLSIFNPLQGIYLQNQQLQQPRFVLGRNNAKRFPFNLNAKLMKIIMQHFYEQDLAKTKSGKIQQQYNNVYYFVGTPGLGKSASFFALKHLHDIKVKAAAKVGIPKDSMFGVHYKLFYMNSTIPSQDLFKIIHRQVKQDLGLDLQTYFLDKSIKTVDKFLELKTIYKHFTVRFIVDQFNYIYNLKTYQERVPFLENWRAARLGLNNSLFLVSSKNNPTLPNNDPVAQIQNNRDNRTKINIDDEIQVEQRLAYSVEAILFQLQKAGISRNNSIEIVKNIRNFPLVTRMLANEIKKEISRLINQLIDENKEVDVKMIAQKISTTIKNSFARDNQNLIKNINSFGQQVTKQQLKAYLKSLKNKTPNQIAQDKTVQLSNIMNSLQAANYILEVANNQNLTVTREFKRVVQVRDQNNQLVKIQCTTRVLVKQIKTIQQDKVRKQFESINYYFIGKVNGKSYMICSFSLQQCLQIRTILMYNFIGNSSYLEKLNLVMEAKGKSFGQLVGGHSFQNGLQYVLNQNNPTLIKLILKRNRELKMIAVLSQDWTNLIELPLYLLNNHQKKTLKGQNKENKLIQTAEHIQILKRQMENSSSIIFRCGDNNKGFDFVALQTYKQQVNLVLIDCYYGLDERKITQKIVKLYSMLQQQQFQKFVDKVILSDQKFKKLHIQLSVLIVPQSDEQQIKTAKQPKIYQLQTQKFFKSLKQAYMDKFKPDTKKKLSDQQYQQLVKKEKQEYQKKYKGIELGLIQDFKSKFPKVEITIDHSKIRLGVDFQILDKKRKSLTKQLQIMIKITRQSTSRKNKLFQPKEE